MIRFFPGMFGNSISSEFACVSCGSPLKRVVLNRSKLIKSAAGASRTPIIGDLNAGLHDYYWG